MRLFLQWFCTCRIEIFHFSAASFVVMKHSILSPSVFVGEDNNTLNYRVYIIASFKRNFNTFERNFLKFGAGLKIKKETCIHFWKHAPGHFAETGVEV